MALLRGGTARARRWRRRWPGAAATPATCWRWSRSASAGRRWATRRAAARAYGSIIDLFPGRADLRRFAGERLERVRGAAALALAIDTFRKAVEQRPDHPASHRLLGFALLKAGRPHEAFDRFGFHLQCGFTSATSSAGTSVPLSTWRAGSSSAG